MTPCFVILSIFGCAQVRHGTELYNVKAIPFFFHFFPTPLITLRLKAEFGAIYCQHFLKTCQFPFLIERKRTRRMPYCMEGDSALPR